MNSNISPKFEWNEFFWETVVNFPDWAGLQERNGPYGAISSQTPSDGNIKIVFASEARGDEPLTENEIILINWFITNQKSVINTILTLIFTSYPSLRKLYIEKFGDEVIEFFPDVNQFRRNQKNNWCSFS